MWLRLRYLSVRPGHLVMSLLQHDCLMFWLKYIIIIPQLVQFQDLNQPFVGELAPMVIHQWRFFLDFRNLRLSLISKNAMRKSTNVPSFRRLLDPRNPFTEAPRSTPQYIARGFRKHLKIILPTALRIYGSRRIKKHEYKNPAILAGFFWGSRFLLALLQANVRNQREILIP